MPLIQMRQQLDQYVCLRPAKLLPGVPSPLATTKPIDIAVVRENSEGEYASSGGVFKPHTPDEVAIETAVHTRKGVERICRYAFALSRSRRRHVTLATKSNALKHAMVMWDRVFAEVARDYPDVRADKCHVDALAMDFVRKPEALDVVVGCAGKERLRSFFVQFSSTLSHNCVSYTQIFSYCNSPSPIDQVKFVWRYLERPRWGNQWLARPGSERKHQS